jgi:hypothetical protein
MATKEDILEQIVEEHLIWKGYFVRHNIKFLPNPRTSNEGNHSDIDVVGINPLLRGHERVRVVSCKSWQDGFNFKGELKAIRERRQRRGRDAWRSARELADRRWAAGFMDAIERATGSRKFTYVLAVTRGVGDKRLWERDDEFRSMLEGNPIQVLLLRDIMNEMFDEEHSTTLAASEVGRLIQVLRAAGALPAS